MKSGHVAALIEKEIKKQQTSDNIQDSYAGTMDHAMSILDKGIFAGEWNTLHTLSSDAFVIGDAPMITWTRIENVSPISDEGFNKPDVEIFLPVSSLACLHISQEFRGQDKLSFLLSSK